MEAARLLKQGLSEAEVARRVGAHRQSVNRWSQQLAESGKQGLKQAGRAGPQARAEPGGSEEDRAGTETRTRSVGVRHESVDRVACRPSDRRGVRC